jgi:protein-disulfide isomerase
VEFSDYECPFCQLSNGLMEKVLSKHGDRIRLYHRHFPLDTACFKKMRRQMHEHACFAAAAAICAHQQDKFWMFHDAQFQLGKGIDRLSIRGLARVVGLNERTFELCLKSRDTSRIIQQDIAAAVEQGIRGTPTFIMGGPLIDQFQPEGLSMEMFDKLFEALDQAKRDYEARRLGGASVREPARAPARAPAGAPARVVASPASTASDPSRLPEAMAPRE